MKKDKITNLNVKHPCQGCKYFKVCGSNTRTEFCAGRDINKDRGTRK